MKRDITELAPVPAEKRIRYGDEPSQFFDVFMPKTKPVVGAAMMIHGGFWRAKYDLLHTSHLCAALGGAESGDHFVEDQQRTVLRAKTT